MTIPTLISRVAEVLTDSAMLVVHYGGEDMRIVWCNDAVTRDFGYTAKELEGTHPILLRGPETTSDMIRTIDKGILTGAPLLMDINCKRKDGTEVWFEVSMTPTSAPGDDRSFWIFLLRDITDRVALTTQLEAAKQELKQAKDRLMGAIDALPDAFALFDKDDRVALMNTRFSNLYSHANIRIQIGDRYEDLLKMAVSSGVSIIDGAGEEGSTHDRLLAAHRRAEESYIIGGRGMPYFKVQEVRMASGDTVGFRTDITELKEKEAALEHQAAALQATMTELEKVSRTDALTELGNRRGLDLTLQTLAADGSRPALACLHVDLDRFKPINDVFGHAAGDHVLKVVSKILRDAVSDDDFVARIGGDEFTVLLIQDDPTTLARRANEIATGVIQACTTPIAWQENVLRFGCSIGVAIGPISEAMRLIQNADIALYEAKRKGRNQSARFTPDLRKRAEDRKRLADELLTAIAEDQIIAYYQPQICAETGAPLGVEALVRWQHPTQGVLAPGQFLPVAEEIGVSEDLDRIVLRHGLETARRCADAGVPLPKLSVNISFQRIYTLGDLQELENMRPWPCDIAFELVETIDFEAGKGPLQWTLDGLRDLGISIEIDDFGSGHASLTTLLQINPDRIKIDRQIVAEAAVPGSGVQAMVRAITDLARGLKIATTAEGIETAAQAKNMQELGCDVLQGYYFGRPMPREALVQWMHNQTAQVLRLRQSES